MAAPSIPAFQERLPVERPEDCVSRLVAAVGTGLVTGGIAGAVTANWANVPPVLQNKPWPALKQTGAQAEWAAWVQCVRQNYSMAELFHGFLPVGMSHNWHFFKLAVPGKDSEGVCRKKPVDGTPALLL
jgi:hypothetical protein